jgi:hypothetical protein
VFNQHSKFIHARFDQNIRVDDGCGIVFESSPIRLSSDPGIIGSSDTYENQSYHQLLSSND